MDFVHLHVHDQFSVLDGVGTCNSYVSKAKELGFKHLALTNHANIDGLIKFQKCCVENDIKPILGCELYIVHDLKVKEDKEKRGHILVLVKDAVGWNNLTKMLSIANIDGFYKRPRVDYQTVLTHSDGLIFATACASSFIYNDCGENFLENLLAKTNDVYLELMPINYEGQKKHNKKIIRLKSKFPQLKFIATNDCHYPNEKDYELQEMLLAIQTKVKWNDPKRWRFETTDLFMKSRQEMFDSFVKSHKYIDTQIIEEALNNTLEVAEKCNFLIERSKVFFPSIVDDARKYVEDYCIKNLQLRVVGNKAEYRKRLYDELNILDKMGFLQYFVIIQDIVLWCKKNNVLVGPGRGSVGGSVIAYLMDITSVDPIIHNLLFERFISPDRVDLPDIDVDFEDTKRKSVRAYLENKYGLYNVASVSTFLQMKTKMVFRDICRVKDVPLSLVNNVSKGIDDLKDVEYGSDQREGGQLVSDLSKAMDSVKEGLMIRRDYPEIESMCNRLNGQVRGIGKHAAAAIITKDDLRDSDRCNLIKRDDVISINWDKRDAEYVGMLKVDILGLSNLSIMHYVKDLVKERYKVDLDFDKINLKDKRVLNEFALGNCVGVFQFGTYGLRKLCKDLNADSFELLTHITALYRPASLRSEMDKKVIKRRAGIETSLHNNPLDEVLLETYGVILYQEQVMQIVYKIAGMSFVDADKIRKLLDKEDKDKLNQNYMRKFVNGCASRGIERTVAIEIWEELLSHAAYGFNRSHAVAYTILSFANMYCKVYYPTEFICASLTFAAEDKKAELIEEAERLHVKVMTPKIGISLADKWISKGKTIYMPFIDIYKVGEKNAEKLAAVKPSSFFPTDDQIKGKLKQLMVDISAYDKDVVSTNKAITFVSNKK